MDSERVNKLLIVGTLCAVGLLLAGVESTSLLHGGTVPEQVHSLAMLVLGGLLGLLGKTSSEVKGAQPVTVENSPGDPVPVHSEGM